ncbi:MAG: hypothetical protein AAGC55_01190, partial [Myxococcota bacterium]
SAAIRRAGNGAGGARPGLAGEHLGRRSAELLSGLRDSVGAHSAQTLLEAGIHEELTRIVDTTAEICSAVHSDYFDPPLLDTSQAPS